MYIESEADPIEIIHDTVASLNPIMYGSKKHIIYKNNYATKYIDTANLSVFFM